MGQMYTNTTIDLTSTHITTGRIALELNIWTFFEICTALCIYWTENIYMALRGKYVHKIEGSNEHPV